MVDSLSVIKALKIFVLSLIGLFVLSFILGIVSSTKDSSRLYEVECWRGKEYSFHSTDIVWYVTTSSGLLAMQDVYGTEYVIADSCSFKEARKEK